MSRVAGLLARKARQMPILLGRAQEDMQIFCVFEVLIAQGEHAANRKRSLADLVRV